MSALAGSPTKLPLRSAMEARDLPAAVDAFAPDAVFRSPLTDRLTFNGRAQIRALVEVILEVFEDLRYTDELLNGRRAVLVAEACVAGTKLELVDHIELDESGKIRELTVFFRPLPATTAAMRSIGAGLGHRKSGARAGVISLLTRPFALLAAVGDRIGVALLRPTV